ncbi:Uncharacterised protein [Salmonella enterica subsp. enterica]|nr:Uncharacterised protein [Salmonella enterica subsp. enterica]
MSYPAAFRRQTRRLAACGRMECVMSTATAPTTPRSLPLPSATALIVAFSNCAAIERPAVGDPPRSFRRGECAGNGVMIPVLRAAQRHLVAHHAGARQEGNRCGVNVKLLGLTVLLFHGDVQRTGNGLVEILNTERSCGPPAFHTVRAPARRL